jgi:hypothetical protein
LFCQSATGPPVRIVPLPASGKEGGNPSVGTAFDFKSDGGSDEVAAAELWRAYFRTVAIAERKNDALQRRFIPIRYRKNLTEDL